MNTPAPSLLPFPEVVDNTMMSCAFSCEQKFFFEFIEKLAPAQKSIHLHAGGAFAHGLEHTRRGLWQYGESLRDALIRGTKEVCYFWEPDYDPQERTKAGNLVEHHKSFGNIVYALWDYFREYPPTSDPVKPYMKSDNNPAVEFTFAIPTHVTHPTSGNPILYGGRADLIGYYGDLMVLMDEKTTKSIGKEWAKQWKLRGQFIGYCFAAQYYGMPIKTFITRGIGIQKTQFVHAQAVDTYSQWQVERWWEMMNRKLERLVQTWKDRSYLLSYGDACTSYGGCDMLDLCTSKNPENWYGDFVRRDWNPLNKDPSTT